MNNLNTCTCNANDTLCQFCDMIRWIEHNEEMVRFTACQVYDGLLGDDYDTQRERFDSAENPYGTEKERIQAEIEALKASGSGVYVGLEGARILAEMRGDWETQVRRIGGMRSNEALDMFTDTEWDAIEVNGRSGFWSV